MTWMLIGNNLEIIVDGYNFLMTTGMMGTQVADIELKKGRRRLLDFLVHAFPDQDDRKKFTVVFDSRTKLSLPTSVVFKDLKVLFSKGYDSADDLIMELIRANHVPKRLLVVSSDHEIQTCAQRRKAKFIDSDQWLDVIESSGNQPDNTDNSQNKSTGTQPDELAYWVNVFSQELPGKPEQSIAPVAKDPTQDKPTKAAEFGVEKELTDSGDFDAIFPPGYGEDLLDEDLLDEDPLD